jgi:uncharacterized membrane protein HdeD (DUF308 family)
MQIKAHVPILSYGAILVIAGVFLLFSKLSSLETINLALGSIFSLAAVPAFIAVFYSPRKSVQLAYHALHAFALIIYGIAMLLFCKNPEQQMYFTAFLLTFYSLSEIIFCSWIFNLAQTALLQIVVVRVLLALFVGVGTVVALNYSIYNMRIFGLLFMLVGINVMLYLPVMKAKQKGRFTKVLLD